MVASAGQIQVGGTNGLTTSYIGSGNCGGNCSDQYNYDEVLFNNLAGTTPTPYSGYTTYGTPVGGTITDSTTPATTANPGGITFNMINDGSETGECAVTPGVTGVCGTSNNFWALTGDNTLQTLTIPVGLLGVSQVWSMLNTDNAGASNAPADRSYYEILNFGTSGGTILSTVTVKFVNTGDTSTPGGQIQSAILCTTITNCNGDATPNGGPLQTTNPTTLTSNGVSVSADADNVYAYNNGGNTLVLNDTGLLLGTLNLSGGGTNLNNYLVNVQIEETGSTSYPNEFGAVSALTVVTAATPEPSTVFMFLSGLGAIGFAGFRRRKA